MEKELEAIKESNIRTGRVMDDENRNWKPGEITYFEGDLPPAVLEPHPFTKLRMRVNAALSDGKTTVGTTIQWDSPMLFAGNQAPDDPPLSIVLVDECGRLWKEYHSKMAAEQVHKLVCILDPRCTP